MINRALYRSESNNGEIQGAVRIVSSALLILGFFYLVAVGVFLSDLVDGDPILNLSDFNLTLSLVALVIFSVLFTVGTFSRAFYFFALPFVVLVTPNAVNDLLPSFWAGPLSDLGVASVSLVTHLDFYLLLGVALYGRPASEASVDHLRLSSIIVISVVLLVTGAILGWLVFSFSNPANPILFFGNNFQIRYLLYTAIFIRFLNHVDCQNFFRGLYLAVLLLVVESIVYTTVFGAQELTSGNFGTNTFAVLLGFVVIILIKDPEIKKYKKILYLSFVLGAVLLTGTRSVMLWLPSSLIIYGVVARFGLTKPFIFGVSVFSVCGLVFMEEVATYLEPAALLIETDYAYLVSRGLVGGELASILTRLSLWMSSIGIIFEFPLGIGLSNFNYIKSDFGYSTAVFIDPHNDMINSYVQNGLIGGTVFLGLIFFGIFALDLRGRHQPYAERVFPLLIFGALTGLTNSNFNKHQFFFLFSFVVFCVLIKKARPAKSM